MLSENEVKANYDYDNNKYNINDNYYENLEIIDNTYTIADINDLETFRDEVNSGKDFSNIYVYMTDDIDLSEITSWIPIGTQTIAFNGIFDGNGYSIINLNIDNSSSYQGLFANNAGIIENVNIQSGTVKGTFKVGAIAGINSGSILNCSNNAIVDTTSYHTGGICGYNTGAVQRCSNTAQLLSDGTSSGGIVGRSDYGIIKFCSNTAKIDSTINSVGGIVGTVEGGVVSSCYNTADVTSTGYNSNYHSYVGGIIGNTISGGNESVKFCYNTGNITAEGCSAGGINGVCYGTISYCYNTGNITAKRGNASNNAYAGGVAAFVYISGAKVYYCYNTGEVICSGGTNKYPGGIAGYNISGATISNSYTLSTKISTIIGRNLGTSSSTNGARTEANMKTSAFVTLIGGTEYWTLDGGFPKLAWE